MSSIAYYLSELTQKSSAEGAKRCILEKADTCRLKHGPSTSIYGAEVNNRNGKAIDLSKEFLKDYGSQLWPATEFDQ
jgi:hypothetical protein